MVRSPCVQLNYLADQIDHKLIINNDGKNFLQTEDDAIVIPGNADILPTR